MLGSLETAFILFNKVCMKLYLELLFKPCLWNCYLNPVFGTVI